MRVELGFTPVWPSPQTPGGLPPPKELGFPVNPKAPESVSPEGRDPDRPTSVRCCPLTGCPPVHVATAPCPCRSGCRAKEEGWEGHPDSLLTPWSRGPGPLCPLPCPPGHV